MVQFNVRDHTMLSVNPPLRTVHVVIHKKLVLVDVIGCVWHLYGGYDCNGTHAQCSTDAAATEKIGHEHQGK